MIQTRQSLLNALIFGLGLVCFSDLSFAAAPPDASPVGKSTADHTKFEALDQDFATGPEVTKACLSCHTEASKQIHRTKHWTWEVATPQQGNRLGKKNVINNFCVALSSNYPRCTSCHIGYGWKDDSFDFASQENVDCLVCHDTTGTYQKFPVDSGHPNYVAKEWPMGSGKIRPAVDLKKVAKAVGQTSRDNCGTCHFYGGGGNAVKHGDLDTSLFKPTKDLDVHMAEDGLNFSCSTCHRKDGHDVAGSRFTPKATDTAGIDVPGKTDGALATCQSCHGDHPMKDEKLNEHVDKVACQTCHVPAFARGGLPTKMRWDWSTAGRKTEAGKPAKVESVFKGFDAYDGMKGDFVWAENVVPDYVWFNGDVTYTLMGERVEDPTLVRINRFGGSAEDPNSRIWPVKRFTGKQPFDPVNKLLIVPHLFGKDDTAYWKNYDWAKAAETGMKSVGLPFSGQIEFVESEMLWPITHMVPPAEKALACDDCHARDGRLANVSGVYMPGRDYWPVLDMAGFGIAGLTLIGVFAHGLVRVFTGRKEG